MYQGSVIIAGCGWERKKHKELLTCNSCGGEESCWSLPTGLRGFAHMGSSPSLSSAQGILLGFAAESVLVAIVDPGPQVLKLELGWRFWGSGFAGA